MRTTKLSPTETLVSKTEIKTSKNVKTKKM